MRLNHQAQERTRTTFILISLILGAFILSGAGPAQGGRMESSLDSPCNAAAHLQDSRAALQVVSSISPSQAISTTADINGDQQIGLAEALNSMRYILFPPNEPPVLDSVGGKSVTAGHMLSFQISGSDPEGGFLAYSAPLLPQGAEFDPSDRMFSWLPSTSQVGVHDATFAVEDPRGAVCLETAAITVLRPEFTERWDISMDGGTGTGWYEFNQAQDGQIWTKGNWSYSYMSQGDTTCPFHDGPAAVNGTSLSFSASGTATNSNPSLPSAYQTSPFTLDVTGECSGGSGSGAYTLHFTQTYWPPEVTGTWTGTRASGGGITYDAPPPCTLACSVNAFCTEMRWSIGCESGASTREEECHHQWVEERCIKTCSGTIEYQDSGNSYSYDVVYDWVNCGITLEVDGIGTCSSGY